MFLASGGEKWPKKCCVKISSQSGKQFLRYGQNNLESFKLRVQASLVNDRGPQAPWFVSRRQICGQKMTKLKRKPGAFQIYTFLVPTLHSLAAKYSITYCTSKMQYLFKFMINPMKICKYSKNKFHMKQNSHSMIQFLC